MPHRLWRIDSAFEGDTGNLQLVGAVVADSDLHAIKAISDMISERVRAGVLAQDGPLDIDFRSRRRGARERSEHVEFAIAAICDRIRMGRVFARHNNGILVRLYSSRHGCRRSQVTVANRWGIA